MSDYVYGQPGATDDSNPYGKPEQKPSGALRRGIADKALGFGLSI